VVGVLLVIYIHFLHVWLAHMSTCLIVWGDKGIRRKYRNHEVLLSTWKVLVATPRQYWWDSYTKTMH